MRVYVSGPLSLRGTLPDPEVQANAERMRAAEKQLTAAGHEVVSPLDVAVQPTWADYMRAGITLLVTCDAICLLPGAEHSPGARLEALIAEELGMAVIASPS